MKRTSLSPLRTRRLAALDRQAAPAPGREASSRLKTATRRSLALAGLVWLFDTAGARATEPARNTAAPAAAAA